MIDQLLKLARTLRGKNGCPWDKKLTLSDIPPMLIDESDEIREAIEKADWDELKKEIGDVLFNLCLLIVIAGEKKLFTPEEVIEACSDKIISRHTWVFGKDKAKNAEEALKLWKKNKKLES